MSISTSTTEREFNMSSAELLAAAMERTAKGNLTIGAKRARTEIERRDRKRELKAGKVTVAPAAKVTDAQVDDLVKQARKVASRIAGQTAGEVAEPGDFLRTKIRLRKDLLVALDRMGAQDFLATFADA